MTRACKVGGGSVGDWREAEGGDPHKRAWTGINVRRGRCEMRRNYLPLRIISRAPKQPARTRIWFQECLATHEMPANTRETARGDTRSTVTRGLAPSGLMPDSPRKWHRDSLPPPELNTVLCQVYPTYQTFYVVARGIIFSTFNSLDSIVRGRSNCNKDVSIKFLDYNKISPLD